MTEELTVEVQLVGTGIAPADRARRHARAPDVVASRSARCRTTCPSRSHYDLSSLVDYDATITVADLRSPRA